MSIRFDRSTNLITIRTRHTQYVIELLYGKYPVHRYYGKITREIPGRRHWVISFSPYDTAHGLDYLADMDALECPVWGSGDFRASALRLVDTGTGDDSANFIFKSLKITKGRPSIPGIPSARADENTQTLAITLADTYASGKTGVELTLYYAVFPEEDVITRWHTVNNVTDHGVRIARDMSYTLDLPRDASTLDLIAFHGAYGQERKYERVPVTYGQTRLFSRRGTSSHMFNPSFFLCDRRAGEESGECWGFNLVWSGSFSAEIETEQTGSLRVTEGLGEECFAYDLAPGASFTSPEGVLSYSLHGVGGVSRQLHRFIRAHILPPEPFERRPVVLNSWEACYFNINEEVLVDFAREAASVGMDMLVMDDGWFGSRTNDRRGLGDWWYNPDRFPNGLASFVDRVHKEGVKFGIWVEPEMVNPDSDLYRAHPDWAFGAPDRIRLESRNQLVLDMGNPAVVQYLKETFAKSFDGVDIDYFKWDMNRHLMGVWSSVLPPERQGEAYFRYCLGVYELFDFFRARFPHAMIENCSGGGGRYDLAMMTYSTQIWTSDNTEPHPRTLIQYSSTFGYPAATMSCHVSNHGNAVEDPIRMAHNYNVAINGPLGYELNILKVSEEAKAVMRRQIADYRTFEPLILRGDLYRLLNPYEGSRSAWYFASEDNSELLLTVVQNYAEKKPVTAKLKLSRALPGVVYRDLLSGETFTGDELRRGIPDVAAGDAPRCITRHLVAQKG